MPCFGEGESWVVLSAKKAIRLLFFIKFEVFVMGHILGHIGQEVGVHVCLSSLISSPLANKNVILFLRLTACKG